MNWTVEASRSFVTGQITTIATAFIGPIKLVVVSTALAGRETKIGVYAFGNNGECRTGEAQNIKQGCSEAVRIASEWLAESLDKLKGVES